MRATGEVTLALVLDLGDIIQRRRRRSMSDCAPTVDSQPEELWIYEVSASSMYGEPYQRPSIRRRGRVIRNSSLPPPSRSTVKMACPICLTMMLPPEKLVFWAE